MATRFGHAIENQLGYGDWLHGEAVALGMLMAAHLSHALELLSADAYKRIDTLLHHVGYPAHLPSRLSSENCNRSDE